MNAHAVSDDEFTDAERVLVEVLAVAIVNRLREEESRTNEDPAELVSPSGSDARAQEARTPMQIVTHKS
jgi:hypothetical protein